MADVEEKDPDDTLDQTLPNNPDQSEATESEYDPYAYTTPKLSDLTIFQEWQDSAPRDRFTEEFSLARYPKQGVAGSGPLVVPEWFPKSYIAYANTFDPYMSSRLQETVFPTLNEEEQLAALLREMGVVDSGLEEAGEIDPILEIARAYGDDSLAVPIIGITPPDLLAANNTSPKLWNPEVGQLVDNPNYNPDAVLYDNVYDLTINDKTYLKDPNQIGVLSGAK